MEVVEGVEGVIRRSMPLVHRPGPSLPQDLAFQSVFEQTIRRGGHVEADVVNVTGSQARPALHSNIQHGFRGQALVVKTCRTQGTWRRRRGNKVVNAGRALGSTRGPCIQTSNKASGFSAICSRLALDFVGYFLLHCCWRMTMICEFSDSAT